MPTLLVVDDEPIVRYSFRRVFAADDVAGADRRAPRPRGWQLVREHGPTWSSSTCNCPTGPAWTCSATSSALDPQAPVIFITGHGTTETAIEAMKQRRLRLPAQAAGPGPAQRGGRAGPSSRPADARAGRAARPRTTGRPPRRPLPGHAGGVQGDRPGRAAGRDRADPRRERHRQGAGRPRHLPAQPPGRQAVPGDQLRRHPRDAAGERAVRPREGRVHRAPTAGGSASSSSATAARCSSTRSAT